nr:thioredoxin domain-containing protein [uncultured Halomonas sp.]
MKSPTHTKTIYIAAGATLAAVFFGFQAYQTHQLSQVSQSVSALGAQTQQNSAQLQSVQSHINSGTVMDSDTLAKAVESTLEKREQDAAAQRRSAVFDKWAAGAEEGDFTYGEWVYGNPDARFTLYTFADTQCSFCQRFHSTPKSLVDSSQGILNTQYHHTPIMGAKSIPQAAAAECAGEMGGNKMFWSYLGEVYENPSVSGQGLDELAQTLGLDGQEFNRCRQTGAAVAHVNKQAGEARDRGVNGTPTSFLIDNKTGEARTISGAQPAGAIMNMLGQMVRKVGEEAGVSSNG